MVSAAGAYNLSLFNSNHPGLALAFGAVLAE